MSTPYPTKASLYGQAPHIFSKKFRVVISGKRTTLAEAEAAGLVEVFYDRDMDTYSYIVKATGEVVSYFLGFNRESWPQWLKDHKAKQGQAVEIPN